MSTHRQLFNPFHIVIVAKAVFLPHCALAYFYPRTDAPWSSCRAAPLFPTARSPRLICFRRPRRRSLFRLRRLSFRPARLARPARRASLLRRHFRRVDDPRHLMAHQAACRRRHHLFLYRLAVWAAVLWRRAAETCGL